MKTPREISAPVLLCACAGLALLGWLAAGLAAGSETQRSRGKSLTQTIADSHDSSNAGKHQKEDAGFAHLQAVAASMAEGTLTKLPAYGALATMEAEELAACLMGEKLAARAQDDPRAFVDELSRTGDDALTNTALTAWAARDPAAAFNAVLYAPFYGGSAFAAMAKHDPLAMLARLQSAKNVPDERAEEAWENLLKVWAKSDAAGLEAKLSGLKEQQFQDALTELALAKAREDMAAAVAWIKGLPETIGENSVHGSIAHSLSWWMEPEQAKRLYEFDPSLDLTGGLAYNWAEKDPVGGLRWAMEHPDAGGAEHFCLRCLSKAAEADGALALKYFASLTPDLQNRHAKKLAEGLARSDPAAALQWAAALPDEKVRREALAAAALHNRDETLTDKFMAAVPETGPAQLLKKDPAAAARALAGLPEEQVKSAWGYVEKQVGNLPAEGAVLVEALPEGELRNRVAGGLAAKWAASDPVAAAAWVSSLQENDSRAWATKNLFVNWRRSDPAAAAQWMQSLPPGPSREWAEEVMKAEEAMEETP